MRKDQREYDKYNQHARSPPCLKADENEQSTEQIDGCDQIGNYRRREHPAGYADEFYNRGIRRIATDIRELQISEHNKHDRR